MIPLKSLRAINTLINVILCNFTCCTMPEKGQKMLDQMVRNLLYKNRGKVVRML